MIIFCERTNMRMNIVFGLTLILVPSIISGQLTYSRNNACKTQDNQTKTCINVRSCPSLEGIPLKKPLTQRTISLIRKFQCGWEGKDPKICCENNADSTPSPPDESYHSEIPSLNQPDCGRIKSQNRNVHGGVPAEVNEFPWMALLHYDEGNGKKSFKCGGSIINSRYILTAAHCVTELPSGTRLVAVRVGEQDLRTENDCTDKSGCDGQYQNFEIEKVIPHSGFSRKTMHDDIALIKLNKNINFTPTNVQTICLPVGLNFTVPDKFKVTGWGLHKDQQNPSSVLRKINVPRFSQDQCVEIYKSKKYDIWHKQICTGNLDGIDGCRGDSGGPLQARHPHKGYETVQYGIVSFGATICGAQGIPGIYTRVDYYIDWISNNMRH